MTTPEQGLEKTALLLMTLGPDEAAEVLKQLGPREVQRISMKMASMDAAGAQHGRTLAGGGHPALWQGPHDRG